jgi:hypothetical protein
LDPLSLQALLLKAGLASGAYQTSYHSALRGNKVAAMKAIAADSMSKQLSGGLVMKLMELKAAGVSAPPAAPAGAVHSDIR